MRLALAIVWWVGCACWAIAWFVFWFFVGPIGRNNLMALMIAWEMVPISLAIATVPLTWWRLK